MKTTDYPGGAPGQCGEAPRQLGAAFASGDAVCAPYYVDCSGAAVSRPSPGVSENAPSGNDTHVRGAGR